MPEITAQDAKQVHRIETAHEKMENGELRFRLRGPDGNGYIRTEAASSGWQKSHFHTHTFETYIVERGWMVLAAASDDPAKRPTIARIEPQQVVTTPLGRVHNVYLPAGAVIHTVKHGATAGDSDWNAAPEFDDLIDQLGNEALGLP